MGRAALGVPTANKGSMLEPFRRFVVVPVKQNVALPEQIRAELPW